MKFAGFRVRTVALASRRSSRLIWQKLSTNQQPKKPVPPVMNIRFPRIGSHSVSVWRRMCSRSLLGSGRAMRCQSAPFRLRISSRAECCNDPEILACSLRDPLRLALGDRRTIAKVCPYSQCEGPRAQEISGRSHRYTSSRNQLHLWQRSLQVPEVWSATHGGCWKHFDCVTACLPCGKNLGRRQRARKYRNRGLLTYLNRRHVCYRSDNELCALLHAATCGFRIHHSSCANHK